MVMFMVFVYKDSFGNGSKPTVITPICLGGDSRTHTQEPTILHGLVNVPFFFSTSLFERRICSRNIAQYPQCFSLGDVNN